jgi:hypothetical protein
MLVRIGLPGRAHAEFLGLGLAQEAVADELRKHEFQGQLPFTARDL